MAQPDRFEIFSDQIPAGTRWIENAPARRGGYGSGSTQYIYVGAQESPGITGLSLPIRAHPGPGEYRYITFAWIKWGGNQIAMKFDIDANAGHSAQSARRYNYTYFEGDATDLTGFRLGDRVSGNWTVVTRDLGNDFGDVTITGVSFLCPVKRDAGFDAVILGRTLDDLGNVPPIVPTRVVRPVDVDAGVDFDALYRIDFEEEPQRVQIDWAAQLKAAGVWMYPL